MVRNAGAQIALLAFAVAIVAGLYAGNSAMGILTRALIALAAGALVGQAAGWTAKLVLREHLQRKKLRIDTEHLAAIRALQVAEPPADVSDVVTVGPDPREVE